MRKGGEYPMTNPTYQIILSTDGRHTVIASFDNAKATTEALAWASRINEQLVKRYGRKGEARQANGEAAPLCGMHKVPMTHQQGKYGPFWSCHERTEDGSFCSYRPAGRQ